MPNSPTPLSLACTHAVRLDALMAADRDDIYTDELLSIAEVFGGLSTHGFYSDLRAALDAIECRLIDDAIGTRDYYAGRGGTDPDAYMSPWLCRRIAEAQERLCADFNKAAAPLLASVTDVREAA